MPPKLDLEADPPGRDELLRACANVRDLQFAGFLTFAIGVAAEKHPEELRAAIGKVFSFAAIEEATNRAALVLADVQRTANETRRLVSDLRREAGDLERYIGALRVDVYELEQRKGPRAAG